MLRLEDLSTEQKLGMLLCARRCWDKADFAYTLELIRNHSLGCVQVPIDENTPKYMAAIREAADYPILIFADMERGYPNGVLPSVPAQTLAACDDAAYIKAYARGIAAQAKAAGFSGTWCPVVDLSCGMGGERRFGSDPHRVAQSAACVMETFAECGFIGTAKHYPGG